MLLLELWQNILPLPYEQKWNDITGTGVTDYRIYFAVLFFFGEFRNFGKLLH
jgi:hypothetical protein